MESLFSYDTHGNVKSKSCAQNPLRGEWRSAHVSIEQYVCRRNGEDCRSGNVIGRSCYVEKYSVREPSVSLYGRPYCYFSLLIDLGALLIEFEIGCEIFWENSSQVICLVSFRRYLDPFTYFLHALNVF